MNLHCKILVLEFIELKRNRFLKSAQKTFGSKFVGDNETRFSKKDSAVSNRTYGHPKLSIIL